MSILSDMKTVDVIKHFRTQVKAARALRMRQPSIAAWGEFPPELRQYQIQVVTNGVLQAEPDLLPSSGDCPTPATSVKRRRQ